MTSISLTLHVFRTGSTGILFVFFRVKLQSFSSSLNKPNSCVLIEAGFFVPTHHCSTCHIPLFLLWARPLTSKVSWTSPLSKILPIVNKTAICSVIASFLILLLRSTLMQVKSISVVCAKFDYISKAERLNLSLLIHLSVLQAMVCNIHVQEG